MAANGILRTAEVVANMETSAISLELRMVDSNLKKKANITRTDSITATMPQFTKAFNEGIKTEEIVKVMTMTNMAARKM